MKFQPDTPTGVNVVSRHEPGRAWIGATPYEHSVLVPWVGEIQPWQAERFEALTPAHFERIAALKPELVIFGSGTKLRFPPPALLRALIERGIGVETMDTGAACRTFNVLVSEQRSVLAALILSAEDASKPAGE
ncbi:MAG: Mth938-like domain-containing protein [Rubrivivax sp.]|nr:Mth938-like domain-containing protein [Rubrivivax sp.]